MFWLMRAKNKISLANKRLLYVAILRPIWTYASPIWDCAADSNLRILQRFQNLVLRRITGAPWYVTNEQLHNDLEIATVKEVSITPLVDM